MKIDVEKLKEKLKNSEIKLDDSYYSKIKLSEFDLNDNSMTIKIVNLDKDAGENTLDLVFEFKESN